MREQLDHVNQKGAAASDDDVLEAVYAVMHAMKARQLRALREAAHGQTPLEGRVLGFFARRPGATQSDLAAHSGRDKGQLARLVGSLRESGLLEASPDETDRRALRLRLTERGQSVYLALLRERRRLAALATADLGAEDRRQLVEWLGAMRERIEQAP